MEATPVATHLRRSIPEHDAYTVLVADRRVAALATATPADARRWICATRWLHWPLLCSGRLVVGLGVQWTPVRAHRDGWTPPPATLQLCVGHRCLVLHLAHLDPDSLPTALYRFLADPRVLFVGYGSSHERRMLRDHYGLHVACGRDLRALAGMGNASVELMAQRFLGYPGIRKPWNVAMSAWHAPRLSVEQVEYACVDAYLAFRLGVLLCPAPRAPVMPPQTPPPRDPVVQPHRAPGPAFVLPRSRAPPPAPRALLLPRAPPPAPRAIVQPRAPPPARRTIVQPRAPPPAPHAPVLPCPPPPAPRAIGRPRVPPPTPRAPQWRRAVAPTSVVVDAAESSSKIAETRPGFTGSDTETDRRGLTLVRSNYASDDDDDDLSSDEFNFLRREAGTDDDEEEEDVHGYVANTGLLRNGDYVVGPGDHSDDDEEDFYEDYVVGTGALNAEDLVEQDYAYKEYAGIGILTVDDHIEEGYKEYTGILTVDNEASAYESEVFVRNGSAFVEEGGLQLDGYHAPPEHSGEAEHYGDSTEAFQGGEDGYGQDAGGDWYDQGDDRYVRDDDSYDAFY